MDIKEYLTKQGIPFKIFIHPPVFTCEEAKEHRIYKNIRGIHSKNLFLKDRRSRRFYLLIIPENKTANMDNLSRIVNNKLKFASEDNLLEILHLTPGSVSPFGLINDAEHRVEVLIDQEVWESEYLSFHPNINTETLELCREDFHRYIETRGNKYRIIEMS